MKWPTHGGLAVHPSELGYQTVEPERRRTNNHHIYFERQRYRDVRWRSIFRNLVDHVVTLDMTEHNELHRAYSGPKVPNDTLMIEVLQDYLDQHGVIECVREHDTNSIYEIQPSEWEFVKGLYRVAA